MDVTNQFHSPSAAMLDPLQPQPQPRGSLMVFPRALVGCAVLLLAWLALPVRPRTQALSAQPLPPAALQSAMRGGVPRGQTVPGALRRAPPSAHLPRPAPQGDASPTGAWRPAAERPGLPWTALVGRVAWGASVVALLLIAVRRVRMALPAARDEGWALCAAAGHGGPQRQPVPLAAAAATVVEDDVQVGAGLPARARACFSHPLRRMYWKG